MAIELDQWVAELGAGVVAAAVADMTARYEVGRSLNELRQSAAAGAMSKALAALSTALGIHPTAIRRYARTAGVLADAEFEALANMRGEHGRSLSWSHVEVLAQVRRSEVRLQLARETVADHLTVQQLARRVRLLRMARTYERSRDDISNGSSRRSTS